MWTGLVIAALLCAGCSSTHYAYSVDPLPVVVQPPESGWDLELAVDFSDVIHVTLVNEGTEPIKVLWDESAYIDLDNQSHRVLTSSAKRAKLPPTAQPASIVAPGSRVEEALVPLPNVADSGLDPLLPAGRSPLLLSPHYVGQVMFTPQQVGATMLGKDIGLFLVLERNQQRKTVLSKYRIADVRVARQE